MKFDLSHLEERVTHRENFQDNINFTLDEAFTRIIDILVMYRYCWVAAARGDNECESVSVDATNSGAGEDGDQFS